MPDDDVALYRRAAEQCRCLAAKAVNPIEKDRLLRKSEYWLKLARAPAIAVNDNAAAQVSTTLGST
jgi:hypothetical protein